MPRPVDPVSIVEGLGRGCTNVESFALVVEEHVCCSVSYCLRASSRDGSIHSATTPRAADAPPVPYVRDMVGDWGAGAEMDGKWSRLELLGDALAASSLSDAMMQAELAVAA